MTSPQSSTTSRQETGIDLGAVFITPERTYCAHIGAEGGLAAERSQSCSSPQLALAFIATFFEDRKSRNNGIGAVTVATFGVLVENGSTLRTSFPKWNGWALHTELRQCLKASDSVLQIVPSAVCAAVERWRQLGRPNEKVAVIVVADTLSVGVLMPSDNGTTFSWQDLTPLAHLAAPRYPNDMYPGVCRFHSEAPCFEGLIASPALRRRFGLNPTGSAIANNPDAVKLLAYYLAHLCMIVAYAAAADRIYVVGACVTSPLKDEIEKRTQEINSSLRGTRYIKPEFCFGGDDALINQHAILDGSFAVAALSSKVAFEGARWNNQPRFEKNREEIFHTQRAGGEGPSNVISLDEKRRNRKSISSWDRLRSHERNEIRRILDSVEKQHPWQMTIEEVYPVPFYKGDIRLIYVGCREEDDFKGYYAFLSGDNKTFPLNSTNQPIYEANKTFGLCFEEGALVARYARFFFTQVSGRQGRFYIVEKVEDLDECWREEISSEERAAALEIIVPRLLTLEVPFDDEAEFWRFPSTVLFKQSLVKAQVTIERDGQVSMGPPDFLLDDLPVKMDL